MNWSEPETISFDALEQWSYPNLREHQYAFLTDEMIAQELEAEDLTDVDVASELVPKR